MTKLLLTTVLLYGFIPTQANNIAINNTMLTGANTTAGPHNAANFTLVQFSVSWDNSWRLSSGPSNWDAAWVFVKFRAGATNPVLTSASSSGSTITVSSTANLRVGMPVRLTSGTGSLRDTCVITSITNGTQFVVSPAPVTALSGATLTCSRIWEHAFLNNTGHATPNGSSIDIGLLSPSTAFNATTNPGLGAFVYRSSAGSGTASFDKVQLRWNYGANGLQDTTTVEVRVFGIEMVYVPTGTFNVGGGGGTVAFTSTTINTGDPTVAPSGTGSLGGQAGGRPPGFSSPTAGAAWPNGYSAFYCLKYEISQGQFRDFLNTLSRFQQTYRFATAISIGTTSITNRFILTNTTTVSSRNSLRCNATVDARAPITVYCDLDADGVGNENNDGEWLACNFLAYSDIAAYGDWSGLRPMTEMEYEKACRGADQLPVTGEFAWGTTSATSAAAIANAGTSSESVTTSGANYILNAASLGPLRVGSFATSTSTTRSQSGATYYGILDMSGNLGELVILLGTSSGSFYNGSHGNGQLTHNGNANPATWNGHPGAGIGPETLNSLSSYRHRGGRFTDTASSEGGISGRGTSYATRNSGIGGRLVRTAP